MSGPYNTGRPHDSLGRVLSGGTYGTGNRIQAQAGCTYTTTSDGSVATRSTCAPLVIRWTAEGNFPMRIRVGTAPDTTVYTFFQDPEGRLARMDKNGAVYRYFLWNGDDLYAELDTTGAMLTEYSWYPGLDRLHQFKDGATGYNAGTDAMGNVIVLTTSTGVYRTYEYSAYGDSVGGADGVGFGGRDRARFKGALYFPEVDLYYMRNRWYEPRTGRFLSEDPVGTGADNRYVFAGDEPINRADPTGTFWFCYNPSRLMIDNTWQGDPEALEISVTCQWFADGGGGAPGFPGRPGADDFHYAGGGDEYGGGGGSGGASSQRARTQANQGPGTKEAVQACMSRNFAPVAQVGVAVGIGAATLGGTLYARGRLIFQSAVEAWGPVKWTARVLGFPGGELIASEAVGQTAGTALMSFGSTVAGGAVAGAAFAGSYYAATWVGCKAGWI